MLLGDVCGHYKHTVHLYWFRGGRWVIISMMLLRKANIIVKYNRKKSGLSSAQLDNTLSNIIIVITHHARALVHNP